MSPAPESNGLLKRKLDSVLGLILQGMSLVVLHVLCCCVLAAQSSSEALLACCGQCFVPCLNVVSFN